MPRELTKPCRKQDGLGALLPVPAAGPTTWPRGKSLSFVAEDVYSIDAANAANLWTLSHTRIYPSCACLWRTFTKPWNITSKAQCRPPWKSLVTAWDMTLPVPLAKLRNSLMHAEARCAEWTQKDRDPSGQPSLPPTQKKNVENMFNLMPL
jgi:hypothetical protein